MLGTGQLENNGFNQRFCCKWLPVGVEESPLSLTHKVVPNIHGLYRKNNELTQRRFFNLWTAGLK